jgi:large subunit ribosomal protein L9
MKIILIRDVEKLGKKGSVTEVKDGFARNYLLPCGFAQECTPEALNLIEIKRAKEEKNRARQQDKFKELAEKLSEVNLTISVKAKNEEEIFGSVTAKIIADALEQEEGIQIDKDKIELSEPLKKLGIYKVKVNLLQDINPELKIWIVKSK